MYNKNCLDCAEPNKTKENTKCQRCGDEFKWQNFRPLPNVEDEYEKQTEKVYEKIYIFVKEESITNTPFIFEYVLDSFFKRPKQENKTSQQVLESAKKYISEDDLKNIYESKRVEVGIKEKTTKLSKIELVLRTATPWYNGTYYAHEYNRYAKGRIRKLTYSNGFKEYQVQCLDFNLIVLDGIWEESNTNGCGDRFQIETFVNGF
jgi:hypothetical protein